MIEWAAAKLAWSTRKVWGVLIAIIAVLAIVGGTIGYIAHLNNKVTDLTGQRDKALQGMMTAKAEQAELQRSVALAQRNLATTNRKLAEARNDAQTYRKRFEDHNLETLAAAKPGLVTRFARRATELVLDDLETAINSASDSLSQPAGDRPGAAAAAPADRAGG